MTGKSPLPTLRVPPVPLVAPCITDIDRECMHNAVELGLLEHGLREVERFEEMFAALVGCEWAVAVNSGTSALTVAFTASDLLAYTLIPSWSCVAVRNAAQQVAVDHLESETPRYYDTQWDVRTAEARCSVIWDSRYTVAVHMFGRPVVNLETRRFDHFAVEDWTLSLGGVGSLAAPLGVCSTNASKMISTGRGGVIFGDDDDLHEQVKALVHYESHTGFGYSVAMSPLQAALGVSQLAQLDDFIARRRELAARYTLAFRPAGIECPDADCGSVFFRYLIATKKPWEKVAALADRGIEAGRGVYPPLHQLAGLPDADFPGTTAAVNSLLSVPVHPSITDVQADHIIESVLEVCAP